MPILLVAFAKSYGNTSTQNCRNYVQTELSQLREHRPNLSETQHITLLISLSRTQHITLLISSLRVSPTPLAISPGIDLFLLVRRSIVMSHYWHCAVPLSRNVINFTLFSLSVCFCHWMSCAFCSILIAHLSLNLASNTLQVFECGWQIELNRKVAAELWTGSWAYFVKYFRHHHVPSCSCLGRHSVPPVHQSVRLAGWVLHIDPVVHSIWFHIASWLTHWRASAVSPNDAWIQKRKRRLPERRRRLPKEVTKTELCLSCMDTNQIERVVWDSAWIFF